MKKEERTKRVIELLNLTNDAAHRSWPAETAAEQDEARDLHARVDRALAQVRNEIQEECKE